MCGIVFILSKNNTNIINYVLNSLELIQNRGYDSMGICYFDKIKQKYSIEKFASKNTSDCFISLRHLFLSKSITSNIALAHSRWATHGGKTDINAHPHISQHGNIILVHNGIINNFLKIKSMLLENNFTFYSETDSEVIANLIEYYILYMSNNIEEAIKKTIEQLEGTWGLIIIYTKQLDTYYVTRHGSPLLLGTNDNYTICSSESNGFIGLIYDYIILDNHDIIKVTNNDYKSVNNKKYSINKISYDSIVNLNNQYEHWMIKEIMEQPETIQKAYNYGARILDNNIKLGGLEQLLNVYEYIEYILLIGCGTSFNAGLLGELYFSSNNKFISVKCINASEFSLNTIPNIKNKKKILCIFLTQSGETIDVYNCLNISKNNNCITLGVVNTVDSLIAREVDCGVYLNCGSEISVASTKSFTSMLIVLSLIEMWFNNNYFNNNKKINCLRSLSTTLTSLLYDFKFLKSLENIRDFICNKNINNIFILGKNKLYPIALEASLKIKEVSYIHAEGFSAGSLKHGPFALIDNTNLTILLIDYNDFNNYNNLKSTYYEIKGRETNIFIITNSKQVVQELNINNSDYIIIPKLDYYNEIIFIITLQYLAYNISIAKGINPDKPRNLAKVVSVE
tara:strand:+ start:8027 stop:9901 length:1875 start_codon:yes stop_codon:yes gene_type:complete